MMCLKTPRPQTPQRNHQQRLEQGGAQHQTMLKMTVVGMMKQQLSRVVALVLQDLVPVGEHLVEA